MSTLKGMWSMNKTYVGLSDDNFLGEEGSFVYAENIDNIRNPKGFQLATEREDLYQLDDNVRKILTTRFNKTLVFLDQKIYADNTLIHTFTGNDSFRNAIEIGGYIFVVYTTGTSSNYDPGPASPTNTPATTYSYPVTLFQLKYLLIDNTSTIDTSPVVDDDAGYIIYGTTASVDLYSYNDDFLLVSAGAVIYKIDDSLLDVPTTYAPLTVDAGTQPTQPKIQLRYGVVVQRITQFLDQFRVYANVAQSGVNQSYLYLIGIGNLEQGVISNVIDLQDLYVRGVQSDGAQDWVIAGSDEENAELWIMSGTQKQLMHRERLNSNQIYHFYCDTVFRSDYTLFKNLMTSMTLRTNGTGLMLSGKRYNGYPYQTIQWMRTPSNEIISAIDRKGDYIMLGFSNGQVSRVYLGNDSALNVKAASGLLTTRLFYGMKVGNVKEFEELEIGYELPSGGVIQIDVSVNGGSFVSLRSLSSAEDVARKYVKIYANELSKSTGAVEFNYIQFRFQLNRGTSSITTPVVYDATMFYIEHLRNTRG